ncbi:MAG: phosphatidate cytidylyltransferase [Candidatus Omnitrophica bacterium]|nr:phosphatidate cytidylyltransferase [Candidatus Omnitrophota bacterium]
MYKRTFSGIILVVLSIFAVIFRPLCLAVTTLFILVGLWEFFLMIENKQVRLFKIFGLILGGLIPVSIFFQMPITRQWQLFFIVTGLFVLFLLELTRKERQETIFSLSGTIFGVLYVSWCFSFIIRVRNLDEGAFLLGFLVLVVKSQDLGAYLTGILFGKNPLLRRVSPKKTVEGSIGGILFSIAFAFIFRSFLDINTFQVLVLGLILGFIGQLGDLFESLIKRDCSVKDSGNLVPGMGGILDVIDSLIFTAPVFYLYITMLKDISFYHLLFK